MIFHKKILLTTWILSRHLVEIFLKHIEHLLCSIPKVFNLMIPHTQCCLFLAFVMFLACPAKWSICDRYEGWTVGGIFESLR